MSQETFVPKFSNHNRLWLEESWFEVAHTCNSSICEAEAGGPEFKASLGQIPDQRWLRKPKSTSSLPTTKLGKNFLKYRLHPGKSILFLRAGIQPKAWFVLCKRSAAKLCPAKGEEFYKQEQLASLVEFGRRLQGAAPTSVCIFSLHSPASLNRHCSYCLQLKD